MTPDPATQNGRIHAWLENHDGLCAMAPLDWHPPIIRVAARIHDLRSMGYFIEAFRQCHLHGYRNHAFYQLIPDPSDPGRLL